MQQLGVQTWNEEVQILNGGTGHHWLVLNGSEIFAILIQPNIFSAYSSPILIRWHSPNIWSNPVYIRKNSD